MRGEGEGWFYNEREGPRGEGREGNTATDRSGGYQRGHGKIVAPSIISSTMVVRGVSGTDIGSSYSLGICAPRAIYRKERARMQHMAIPPLNHAPYISPLLTPKQFR